MHELPVTESILEIAVRHANENNARSVTRITVVLGSLSSIVDDSVLFYWPILSENTICDGAALEFKRITPEMQCESCDEVFQPGDLFELCPKCSCPNVKLIHGDEFFVDSIEITTSEE
ncbi:MAG TPA: hydrogenase maturation nickel metallochaperone HypA [Bellilinea sp.]|nr:hydrogenase maturation nickel metallochaperone HypA [Bellilinea sp.]